MSGQRKGPDPPRAPAGARPRPRDPRRSPALRHHRHRLELGPPRRLRRARPRTPAALQREVAVPARRGAGADRRASPPRASAARSRRCAGFAPSPTPWAWPASTPPRPRRSGAPPTARTWSPRSPRRPGSQVRVLSGAEEAHFAAQGVISGFFRPIGLVGDMGGGSLEVAEALDDRVGERWVSLPLGALPVAGAAGRRRRRRPSAGSTRCCKEGLPPALTEPVFYAVGGGWRALAKAHMAAVARAGAGGARLHAGRRPRRARSPRSSGTCRRAKLAALPGVPARRARDPAGGGPGAGPGDQASRRRSGWCSRPWACARAGSTRSCPRPSAISTRWSRARSCSACRWRACPASRRPWRAGPTACSPARRRPTAACASPSARSPTSPGATTRTCAPRRASAACCSSRSSASTMPSGSSSRPAIHARYAGKPDDRWLAPAIGLLAAQRRAAARRSWAAPSCWATASPAACPRSWPTPACASAPTASAWRSAAPRASPTARSSATGSRLLAQAIGVRRTEVVELRLE